MEETVYSADSELIKPLRLIRSISSDLRIAPSVAWSLFMRSLQVQYRQTWLAKLSPRPSSLDNRISRVISL
jgi:hypothetical protein